MFVYNLYTKKVERGSMPGLTPDLTSRGDTDSIQQSGDAVLLVLPFAEPDTFSFANQHSTPMGIEEGATVTQDADELPGDEIMKMGTPMVLDALLYQLSIRSAKAGHQDSLHAMLKDPNDEILSLVNPGDWVVCWMFDNTQDANKLRAKLKKGDFSKLNTFNSGLKFVGKALAPRIQHMMTENGTYIKQCSLQATAFSELDSNIYYDPYMNANMAVGYQFITEVADMLNSNFQGLPRSVNSILATLLPVFLGKPPRAGTQATPNASVRVPDLIGRILGFRNVKTFMDILYMQLGVQKFNDAYIPPLFTTIAKEIVVTQGPAAPGEPQEIQIPQTHSNIFATAEPLKGAIYPQIPPFNNVPLWSILEQFLVPVANEMYSCLRMDPNGLITPHLIARQIPFNTDDFVSSRKSASYTAFRELPRWKVQPEMVLVYDTGKSGSMRVNYVQVQVTGGIDKQYLKDAFRAATEPRLDKVDIARHGLKSFITQVNATYEIEALGTGQEWTDMATDRLLGSHLKLSGSISLAGVQEPICVGDNLEYDGFVYHIESIEHRLAISPQTGAKSFSTQLAISNGVPGSGAALPEMGIRQFNSSITNVQGAAVQWLGTTSFPQLINSPAPQTKTVIQWQNKDKSKAVRHTVNPSATVEEDD